MQKDATPYTLLVIEDNIGDYTIVSEFLEEQMANPHLVQAPTFRQARTFLEKSDHGFQAILLDLSLPDKSGEPLINEITSLAGPVPVIVLTGHTDASFAVKSLSLGVSDYLLKDDLTPTILYKSILYNIERKRAIVSLKQSERRYSDLFQLSPQPMWVHDLATLAVLDVNDAAVRQYGYSKDEWMRMKRNDLWLPEDLQVENDGVPASLAHGVFRHRRKSGEIIIVDVRSNCIQFNGHQSEVVLAMDITEKTEFEHRITQAIIKTQEDERSEMSGELHDNVLQLLAAAGIGINSIKKYLDQKYVNRVEESVLQLNKAIQEIRNISHRLSPAFIENSSLEEAFTSMLRALNPEGKLEHFIHFSDEARALQISHEAQLNLYRIMQEQLRNILKHAKAQKVEVTLTLERNKLKLIISDNGVGFDLHGVKKGIGLANMKRRALLFAGSFQVVSAPGAGCVVQVELPLSAVTEGNASSDNVIPVWH